MVEGALLLSLSPDLGIDQITATTTVLTVHLVSTQMASRCPLCGQASEQVHSRYRRVVADVPCGSKPVGGAQVLLSDPDLPTQDLHRTSPRSRPALGSHDEPLAISSAGTRVGDRRRRRRSACSPARDVGSTHNVVALPQRGFVPIGGPSAGLGFGRLGVQARRHLRHDNAAIWSDTGSSISSLIAAENRSKSGSKGIQRLR
jgi:hypothetical protein